MIDEPDFEKFLSSALLKPEPVTVVFTKLDGTERKMKCTKNFSLIPVEHQPMPLEFHEPVVSTDICKVFDLENMGWRSFYWKSVILASTYDDGSYD